MHVVHHLLMASLLGGRAAVHSIVAFLECGLQARHVVLAALAVLRQLVLILDERLNFEGNLRKSHDMNKFLVATTLSVIIKIITDTSTNSSYIPFNIVPKGWLSTI